MKKIIWGTKDLLLIQDELTKALEFSRGKSSPTAEPSINYKIDEKGATVPIEPQPSALTREDRMKKIINDVEDLLIEGKFEVAEMHGGLRDQK